MRSSAQRSVSPSPDRDSPAFTVHRDSVSELLKVPDLRDRIRERDVSSATAVRLGVVSAVCGSLVLVAVLLVMSSEILKAPTPVTVASTAGLLGACVLCGIFTGVWVWAEATFARRAGGVGLLRFLCSYFLGGGLVGLMLVTLVPGTGFALRGPPALTIVSIAVAATCGALILGVIHDGRRRIQRVRDALVAQATDVVLTGTSQSTEVALLRQTLNAELRTSLQPHLDAAAFQLAAEATRINSEVTASAARLLEDLNDSSVRPLSHRLQQRAISAGVSVGPLSFIRGVARHQPFRPGMVTAIFLLTSVPSTWVDAGLPAAAISALVGSALIYLILGLGNVVMARVPQWHTVTFIGFFVLLQVPWMATETLNDPVMSTSRGVGWAVTVAISACIVWLTSGIGEWRAQQASLLRLYADDIDMARLQLQAQDEVVRALTKESARALHGALQSRLAACILALDRAVAANDPKAHAEAMAQARAVLAEPWPVSDEPTALASLVDGVRAKVDLWQGIADITFVIDPDCVDVPGGAADVAVVVIEEALCNAVRHGGADTIMVRVSTAVDHDSRELRIRVADDGGGLRGHQRGLGTAYLDQACPGRWRRSTPPSGGCQLDVKIPLDPLEAETC